MKKCMATLLAGMMLSTATAFAAPSEHETIEQVALLQSLTLGHFDGSLTVKELKKLGDMGIGTFDGLNGEMVVLDGVVYRGNVDCQANVVPDEETIPFGNVTFFERDIYARLHDIRDKSALEEKLGELVQQNGRNSFYMLKLHGVFTELLIRSEEKADKPYPTIVEQLKKTQKEKTLENVQGTVVGLYCPDYMGGLNTVGWHFHFISDDRACAGHVLQLRLESGAAELDKTDGFALHLPDNSDFQKLELGADLREDIRKAENDTQGMDRPE